MNIHMIKLVVGVESLDEYARIIQGHLVDYEGQMVNPVWTRHKPKHAEELVRDGASIYRVIKNRIQCRQKILGFEMVESSDKGTQCLIMVEPQIIQTISTPKRPFQGWRYFEPAAVPRDRGVYLGGGQREEIPAELEEELQAAGLL